MHSFWNILLSLAAVVAPLLTAWCLLALGARRRQERDATRAAPARRIG